MKTAKEWRKIWTADKEIIDDKTFEQRLDTRIKEIQLNAIAEGMTRAAEISAIERWKPGCRDRVYGSVWFIAVLDNGDKVVLRQLPEEYSYDYKTADETYYASNRIVKWMEFMDGPFKNHIEEAILTARDNLKGGV